VHVCVCVDVGAYVCMCVSVSVCVCMCVCMCVFKSPLRGLNAYIQYIEWVIYAYGGL
jgi:hypothetical protein